MKHSLSQIEVTVQQWHASQGQVGWKTDLLLAQATCEFSNSTDYHSGIFVRSSQQRFYYNSEMKNHATTSVFSTAGSLSMSGAVLIALVTVGSPSRCSENSLHPAGGVNSSPHTTSNNIAKEVTAGWLQETVDNVGQSHLRAGANNERLTYEEGRAQALTESCYKSADCAPGIFAVGRLFLCLLHPGSPLA